MRRSSRGGGPALSFSYAVGGAVLGGVAAVIAYYLTIPVVRRYHRRKSLLMARRIARIQRESRRDGDNR